VIKEGEGVLFGALFGSDDVHDLRRL
jgi:hypothetical protein